MIILRWKFADTDISKNAVHKRHCSHHRRLNLTILTNTAGGISYQLSYSYTTVIHQYKTDNDQPKTNIFWAVLQVYVCIVHVLAHQSSGYCIFFFSSTTYVFNLLSLLWLAVKVHLSNMLSPPPAPRFFLGCCLKRSLQVIGWARIHLQSCYFSNE